MSHLPKYLAFGYSLDLSDLFGRVKDTEDFSCVFYLGNLTIKSQLQDGKCIFKPALKFDFDFKDECVDVFLEVSGLIITN